jgi:hypothetical protein
MIHSTKHDLTLPYDLFWPLLTHEKSNLDIEDFTSGMNFKSIVLYLKANGMNAMEIHSDLVATLGMKVFGYSTVTRWLREAQLDQFSETAVDFTTDAEIDEIDEAILSALEVQLFRSVRDIARLIRLARFIVHGHLTLSLSFFCTPSPLDPRCLFGRGKSKTSLKLGTALGDRSGAARQFLVGPCYGRPVLVFSTH